MNDFADSAQKEIATRKKIPKTYYISRNYVPNLLGEKFGIIQHLDTDIVIDIPNTKAYYFEVDGSATINISEADIMLIKTINHTGKGQFTAYKGLVNSKHPVRIAFSGQYPYNIRNIAAFGYTFPSDNDVPDYVPLVKYKMPDDFYSLNKVENCRHYSWEGKNLVVNYYYKGQITVDYNAYPSTILSTTPDTYEFEVDIDAQDLIPLYMAGHSILDENPSVATNLLNEYELKLSGLKENREHGTVTIQDVYGMW
jgi:hypothetical protein